jgi:hypothetical protein
MSIPRNLSKLADGADSSGVLKVDSGGTGATTAADALTNLGAIGDITSNDGSVVISTTGTTKDLSVGIAGSTATLISQVRNETGATLTKGTVVYISGASGNKALVSKAIATGDATSAQTYGMVQADISNNNNGYVVVIGSVSGLNTSAFAEGVQLYLSPTTAGTYTSTKPYAPSHIVYVGVVTRSHATQGTIEVKIQNGYEMDELHDVSAQSPTNGDTLVYVSSTGLWTKTPQSSLSVASAAAVPFSGVTGKPTTLSGYGITDAQATLVSGTNIKTVNGTSVLGSGNIQIDGGVTSFNTRTGAVTLGSSDVTGALGFTPYNATNPAGYITGITSGNVTTALGYTPYNSSNPSGYITSSALSGYAPLTGTGASGTWSINVTGSAGSAGSVPWSGVSSGTRTNYDLGLKPPNSGYAGFYFSKSTSGSTASDAGYLLIRGTSDSFPPYTAEGITLVSDANSLNLFARGSSLVSGGNAWVRMGTGEAETFRLMGDYSLSLNSSRAPIFYDSDDTSYYTSPNGNSKLYSLGLGGATPDTRLSIAGDSHFVGTFHLGGTAGSVGSWGSRDYTVSGTRYFNANSYNFDNYGYGSNWTFTLSSGNAEASSSLRAPIFYDNNNTGYYVDPAGTSRMSNINYDNLYFASDTTYGLIGRNGYLDTVNGRGSDPLELNYYDGGTVIIGAAASKNLLANGLYANIFYEKDNTAYYGDFASTSNLNAAMFAGPIGRSTSVAGWFQGTYNNVGDNSTKSNPIYTIGSSYNPSDAGTGNMYGVGYSHPNFFSSGRGSGWGLYTAAAGTITGVFGAESGFNTWINGYGVSTSSWRAPLFYDYDNTAFYLDPASSSIFNSLNLTSGGLSLSGVGVISRGATWTEFRDASGATKFWLGNDSSIYMNASNYFLRSNDSNSTWVDINSSLLKHSSSLRAPIFYDNEDTSYYCNPNSVSYLWGLTLAGGSYFRPQNWIQMDSSYGIYWPGSSGAPHWHPNDSTYGPMQLSGIKNSYSGIRLPSSNNVTIGMFDSSGNGGLYNYTYWVYYWLVSNACLGVRTSSTSSAYAMYVDGGIYSTGNVVAYSDVRKKKEIVTVDNALATVNKLRGVFYKRIETNDEKVDPNKRQIGVIAQEVNEVLPEAVTYAKDVDEYGVQYGNMAGLFIEAIKELTSTVEKLNSKIEELEKKVNS